MGSIQQSLDILFTSYPVYLWYQVGDRATGIPVGPDSTSIQTSYLAPANIANTLAANSAEVLLIPTPVARVVHPLLAKSIHTVGR